MDTNAIRQAFLDFFAQNGHKVVPSAPIVVKNDPTLMFTNAGMNQFKDFFLGDRTAVDPRVANSQKCLRVSGKHNDLEEVGVDTYHHTMFEMLGNWSFGDYFKKEAIDMAWELLTQVYKLDPERLYVTVFGGDAGDGLEADTEAEQIWAKHVPADRILRCSKKDNFWEMGDTGPCGPCSEIHIDARTDEERAKQEGKALVNQDHPQVIEIWNLVFMQYDRSESGKLNPLPAKHVDTGMGLERLAMVMQGKTATYDIDLFASLLQTVESISGKKYREQEKENIAFRVIVDHIRAVAFTIADGQLPSNTGAGYVIRRILRRAIRYGYQFLDIKEPFMCQLVSPLVKAYDGHFPELDAQAELLEKVIREEEVAFFRTLANGVERIELLIRDAKDKGATSISGKEAFELYDTYGFPLDLTQLMAAENGLTVDQKGFAHELEVQKSRSRTATAQETGDWTVLKDDAVEEFIGYDHLSHKVQITRYRKVKRKKGELFQLVFNLTPFYPEGGGQVGDQGYIEVDGKRTAIIDTVRENELIIHLAKELPDNVRAEFKAVVAEKHRTDSQRNHSATHLLHKALRDVLGTHVEQKGSLVAPDHLRFDFSHFSKMTEEELRDVENRVNAQIQAAEPLQEFRNIPLDEAMEKGAMALFGEKYGDTVRMIQFGDSRELCGGTHVSNSAHIGPFKILSESGVAAGVRRVEAVTGDAASRYLQDQLDLIVAIREELGAPQDLLQAVSSMQAKNKELTRQLESFMRERTASVKSELASEIKQVNGVPVLAKLIDLEASQVKDLLFQLKGENNELVAVIGSKAGGRPTLSLMISESLVKGHGWNAGNWIREVAKHIQGGGGGQPFFATAGGKKADGLQEAINDIIKKVEGA